MIEETAPYSWEGRRVSALIVSPWGMTSSMGVPSSRSLTAWAEEGTLEKVTELGIIASFEQEDEPTISAFYPWSAVLRLHPQE